MEDPRIGQALAVLSAAQEASALEPRRLAAQMQEEVREVAVIPSVLSLRDPRVLAALSL